MLLVNRIPCCRFSGIYTVISEQMNLQKEKHNINIAAKMDIFYSALVKGKLLFLFYVLD